MSNPHNVKFIIEEERMNRIYNLLSFRRQQVCLNKSSLRWKESALQYQNQTTMLRTVTSEWRLSLKACHLLVIKLEKAV